MKWHLFKAILRREEGTNHFAIAHKKKISNMLAAVSRSQQQTLLLHNEIFFLFYFIVKFGYLGYNTVSPRIVRIRTVHIQIVWSYFCRGKYSNSVEIFEQSRNQRMSRLLSQNTSSKEHSGPENLKKSRPKKIGT